MTKISIIVGVSLALLVTVWAPATTEAGGRGHAGGRGGHGSHSFSTRRHGGHAFHGATRSFGGHGHSFHTRGHSFHTHAHSFHGHRHGFGHHGAFPRHFLTFGLVAPPVVITSPIVHAVPSSVFVYAPSVAPAPPAPRVIEYPTGRYELRGDGITTPYVWVWIPKSPPPPPPPPP